MVEIALWGPSDHDRPEDTRALARALQGLGCAVLELPLGAMPPATAKVIVVNTRTRVDAAALAALPGLRLVITTTSGYDHVDLEGAARRGVRVVRCPLARRDAVVDASVAMALALLRRLPRCQAAASQGRWIRAEMKTHVMPAVTGLAVGIFGLGVIGSRAAQVWAALGAEVLPSDPARAGSLGRDAVLERAAIVTLHCSLSPTSRQLIDAAAVARMGPGTILVNTARGDCLDLDAVLNATHLGGIGLDVFDVEPPPRLADLARREDVIVTPHSAGYHAGLAAAVRQEVVAAVTAWLEGSAIPAEVALPVPGPR